MLCKGWNTTCQVMDRNQATNLTLVMGVIYLIYSAYFLSSDFSSMQYFVNAVLAFIYLTLGIINLKSLNEQLNLLRSLVRFADEVVPVAFMQSIKLKYLMLSQFKIVVFIFFMLKFVMYAFNALNQMDGFASVRLGTGVQISELVIFSLMLFIFRPRKQWPDYF